MPSITREMELFANIQSVVTDQLLAAINDSPTLVAQMLAYEANVASGYAKPIEAGGGSAYFPGKPGVLQFIQLDTSSLSNLSTSPKVMLAIDQLAHEFGHYAARSQDEANWVSSGTTESKIVSCLTAEGYAVFNNYAVKREVEAAAQLRGETPYRSIVGGSELLAVLDAIYYTTNGGYSVTEYAGAIGRLYGATTKPGSVNGDYATYVQMCTAIASGGGGANPAPMPVMSSVNGAWTTSWAEPDGSVVQLNIDWGQMATFVTGLGLTSARFRFDLEPNGNIAGDGGTSLLAGESGNDTLVGGDGSSLMLGGAGDDTYYADEGDTIVDSDGVGRIYLGTAEISGGVQYGTSQVFKGGDSTGAEHIYLYLNGSNETGGDLLVDGKLRIKSFHSGDLGIVLGASFLMNSPVTTNEIVARPLGGILGGTTANDHIIGSTRIDTIAAWQGGDDFIEAGLGNDDVRGGGGHDVIAGGGGPDFLYGNDGNDVIYGDDLIDIATALVRGDDAASGFEYSFVYGSGYNLTVLNQYDFLHGGAGEDVLVAGAGNDKLDGGSGSDLLIAGAGNDRIWASLDQTDSEGDVIYAGAGADIIDGSDGGDYIFGGEGNDTVSSRGGRDYVDAGSGDDHLEAGDGDDYLVGGAGSDVLAGGAGSDTFFFSVGDGADVITDGNSQDTEVIAFAAGITRNALTFEADPQGLRIVYGSGDSVLISSYDGTEHIQAHFADGSQASLAELSNQVPIVGQALVAVEATEDSALVFQIPAGAFVDNDLGNNSLVLEATVTTGGVLPTWLAFDAATGTFSGTPGNDDVGNLNIRVVARDRFGAHVSQNFVLSVINVNDAPMAMIAFADQAATEDALFSFQIPANTFVDIDVGDQLNYAAMLADGTALPPWLAFDAATRTLGGTPGVGDIGNLDVRIIATDLSGASASQTFSLVVNAVTGVELTGTAGNDTLTGTHRNDTLDGGVGRDRMIGGAGNDFYYLDNSGDAVVELANEGSDTVIAGITHTLAANVENLTLAGTANLNGTGNELANTLTGNSGANTLNGKAGADTLIGGLGNDTYHVDDQGDVVIEQAVEGTDKVIATVSHTLAANIENLTLSGTDAIDGTGNELNNVIVGNTAANTLSGLGGNDTLNGGAGADLMAGGTGDDTYTVDDSADIIVEQADEGFDIVSSSVSYTLSALIERLTLTGTADIDGSGSVQDDEIIGNTGSNTLSGGEGNDSLDGKAGADTLIGGLGDDTYLIDNTGDTVIEAADEGIDLLKSSITHALADNVENLTLTGSAAINGTGNALANTLIGNSGINTLTGGEGNDWLDGGAGNDILIGGAGDDTYVAQSGDQIIENDGEGEDTVRASFSYTLGATLEKLTLSGTANLSGTGNALDNTLTGNNGNNTLDGKAGADTLIGGLGNDTYLVDDAGDQILENSDEGIDLVKSSVSHTLVANVENLTLSGTDAIDGTGNELDNIIIGNTVANTLSGLGGNDSLNGGAGADLMAGGSGDDSYTVDNLGDQIVEAADEGIDSVSSSITYSLAANVENLILTGTANRNGTGNELANTLTGNSGANILSAGAGNDTLDGKAGTDTLIGGAGDDTYRFGLGNGADTVQENDATAGNLDMVEFLAGVGAEQIWLRQAGNNLELSVIGTTDKLTVQNWYLGSEYRVEQFKTADGKLLLDTQVEQLVQAMAAFAPPPAGQTSLPTTYHDSLAPVIAANWQ